MTTPTPDPSRSTVTGRAEVPATLRYEGELPEPIARPDAARPENAVRNAAVTAAVVLLIAAGTFWIFRPKTQTPSTLWFGPTGASASADPTGASAGPSQTAAPYSGSSPSGVPMPVGDLPGWHQTFTEDFNGGDLAKRWYSYNGQPGGDPGGWFMSSHVSERDGSLVINGSLENTPNGRLYATGGISNAKSFSQTYGKFEARFRMDDGWGINYALLLWPTDNSWPPELNFAEDLGEGRQVTTATVHWGGPGAAHQFDPQFLYGYNFTDWHTVGVEWTPNGATVQIDGRNWHTFPASEVPRVPMSMALQTQAWVCGGSFSTCPDGRTPANVNLQVDWVVAYAMA
jgi:beta-glucanase (GH16 family)